MNARCLKLIRFLYFAAIVGLLTGCGALNQRAEPMRSPDELLNQKSDMMRQAIQQVTYQTPVAAYGHFTVEIQNAYGVKQRGKFQLRQGMFLQDALRESRALDQFQFMTIKLRRPTNDPMRFLPLEIEFNSEHRRIEPINDYAIHDGDYIIVKQTAGGELDEMVGVLRSSAGM
ncbi:MAG: hypothetical protein VX738_11895 [Planctomycetota bacterium]|nr:hypothetical protein [Planctomycetota bacterium]